MQKETVASSLLYWEITRLCYLGVSEEVKRRGGETPETQRELEIGRESL